MKSDFIPELSLANISNECHYKYLNDATGRAVIQKVIHAAHGNFTVDVAHLSHGMYTFTLSNDEQLFIKRLVK